MDIIYSHEFISNRIKDELILHSIGNYREVEENIIGDMATLTGYNIEVNRNINTLSGGQRAILYLITLSYIVNSFNLKDFKVTLIRIVESLTEKNRVRVMSYLKERGIKVEVYSDIK